MCFQKQKKEDVTGVPTNEFHKEDVDQASQTYTAATPNEIDEAITKVFSNYHRQFQELSTRGIWLDA